MDANTVHIPKPFAALESTSSCVLKDVHNLVGADLDVTDFSLEYEELVGMDDIAHLRKLPLSKLVPFLASSGSHNNVAIPLARFLAAKPQCADVDRYQNCTQDNKALITCC